MKGSIAVINAGSSSIKFALYEAGPDLALLHRGQIEKIGSAPHLKVVNAHGETLLERTWKKGELDHKAATQEVLQAGKRHVEILDIAAVGSYAIQPRFSDGHDTGIYSWDLLYDLGVNQETMWAKYLKRLADAGAKRAPG